MINFQDLHDIWTNNADTINFGNPASATSIFSPLNGIDHFVQFINTGTIKTFISVLNGYTGSQLHETKNKFIFPDNSTLTLGAIPCSLTLYGNYNITTDASCDGEECHILCDTLPLCIFASSSTSNFKTLELINATFAYTASNKRSPKEKIIVHKKAVFSNNNTSFYNWSDDLNIYLMHTDEESILIPNTITYTHEKRITIHVQPSLLSAYQNAWADVNFYQSGYIKIVALTQEEIDQYGIK